MSKTILGIDLGTSSVKLLISHSDGSIKKAKAPYKERTPKGWTDAIKEAVSQIDISSVEAIGLSSQVGTYIINEEHVINWDDGIGQSELQEIKAKYSVSDFIREIAMPHPDIISYPIPRLIYISRNFKDIKSVCQPKDYILGVLTGKVVTDKYSFRGLVNIEKGDYSDFFLNEIGIDKSILPPVVSPEEVVGTTTAECEKSLGIPKGIPVVAGLNDFFASVLGMGISKAGQMFDITGTSEHLGVINNCLKPDTKMVSGRYLNDFIHYGVTASSGASLAFAIREFGVEDINIKECLEKNPPIFAPYLNGERAPIFDKDARGVFFGINAHCTKKDMAYSVLEGVSFSLYHIYENMDFPEFESIYVSGGASTNAVLNTLKAELFNATVFTLGENDTSALGAVQIAATALKTDPRINPVSQRFEPKGEIRDILQKRYNIYKKLYGSLKQQFKELSDIRKDLIK